MECTTDYTILVSEKLPMILSFISFNDIISNNNSFYTPNPVEHKFSTWFTMQCLENGDWLNEFLNVKRKIKNH